MKPLGARGAWLALWPQLLTPRASAVSITTFGPSTWQVMTSQPASISALAASASRTGIDHSPVKITCTTASGLTLRAPSSTELMLDRTDGIGLAATKPILPRGGRQTGRDAVHVMRLVEVAEIRSRIGRVGILVPQRSRMAELDIGVFLGRLDHEGAVIAERCGQDQVRAVKVDHRFHRLRDGIGFGHLLLFDDGDAGHLFQHVHGQRMGLVPAEIVARADIDGPQHDGRLRAGQARMATPRRQGRRHRFSAGNGGSGWNGSSASPSVGGAVTSARISHRSATGGRSETHRPGLAHSGPGGRAWRNRAGRQYRPRGWDQGRRPRNTARAPPG